MRKVPTQLQSKVELGISCQKLINMDFLSKSDPCCVVFQNVNDAWKQVGITEMLKDDLNPKFKRTITMEYHFEEQQHLMFEVYDIDQSKFSGRIDKSKDELLGRLKIQLAEIVGSKGQMVKRPLVLPGKKNAGWINVRAEEVNQEGANDMLTFNFWGVKLKKMDLFGKSDPYFIISKYSVDGSRRHEVVKSEIIKNTLNPKWKSFRMKMQQFAGGYDRRLRFDCYDWNRLEKDDYIGAFECTPRELMTKGKEFTLTIPKKPKKSRGTIKCTVKVKKSYSFLEYLSGGMEVSLLCAIDFTGSNGNPNERGTLHYHAHGYMNEYESAIRSIGDILANYDYDNQYPVFGFGAQMPNGQVSHCFALNGNAQNPDVFGVDGILQAYHQALKSVQLYGPTYFSEVINVATAYAQSANVCQDVQKYFILLIITDGIINDMQKTIDAIVSASFQPLSIIIVGVGNANFSAMDQLDCDDGLLRSSKGKFARFDIVQFVPFSKFKNNYQSLAKETLYEVPDQVKSFMDWKKIHPNPKPQPVVNETMGNWGFLKKNVMLDTVPQSDAPSMGNWNFMKQQVAPPTAPGNFQQLPQQFQQQPQQQFQPPQLVPPQNVQPGINPGYDV